MCFLKLCYSMMITLNKGSFTYFIIIIIIYLFFLNSIHSIFQWFNFECQPNLLFNVCNLMLIWGGGTLTLDPGNMDNLCTLPYFKMNCAFPPPPHPPQVGHWSSWALEPQGPWGLGPPPNVGEGGLGPPPPQCRRGGWAPQYYNGKIFQPQFDISLRRCDPAFRPRFCPPPMINIFRRLCWSYIWTNVSRFQLLKFPPLPKIAIRKSYDKVSCAETIGLGPKIRYWPISIGGLEN